MGGAHPWTFRLLVWYWGLSKWPVITHESILGHEEHCLLLLTLVRKEFSGTNSQTRQAKACKAFYKLVHIFPCEIHRWFFWSFFFFDPFITPLISAFAVVMSSAVRLCSVLVHLALYRAGTVPKTPFPYHSWSLIFWHILFPSSQLHTHLY